MGIKGQCSNWLNLSIVVNLLPTILSLSILQVMPALLTRIRPADMGWSKPQKDELVEKLFQTTFPAFKFPDRERLHVTCGVQLCKGKCPKVMFLLPASLGHFNNCFNKQIFRQTAASTRSTWYRQKSSLLESRYTTHWESQPPKSICSPTDAIMLQVRGCHSLPTETHHLILLVDEYKYLPPVKSEGTLCLSSSKLAWSFCILGLIFLVAVIVSLYCLMRHRGRKREIQYQRTTGTSIFSTRWAEFIWIYGLKFLTLVLYFSSSSHSRFPSKLLIPYGGGSGTLPYGRVY